MPFPEQCMTSFIFKQSFAFLRETPEVISFKEGRLSKRYLLLPKILNPKVSFIRQYGTRKEEGANHESCAQKEG